MGRLAVQPNRTDREHGGKPRAIKLDSGIENLTDGDAVERDLAGAGTFACLGEQTKVRQGLRSRPTCQEPSTARGPRSAE